MEMVYVLVLWGAWLIVRITTGPLAKLVRRKNTLQTDGIPLVGGLAIGTAFAIALAAGLTAAGLHSLASSALILTSLLMLYFGFIDDRRPLSIRNKLLVQAVATGLLISAGLRTEIVYLGPFWNGIITLLWIIGITNAFNHLDIADGVATIVAALACIGFGVVAFLNNDAVSLTVCLSLLGGLVGFLSFNLPPARMYLGNSGSHFLGFVLAAIAIMPSYAPLERKVALLSPLFILGFPVFDTVFLIVMRLAKGRHPFAKSNDHIVLRLLSSGWSRKKVLGMLSLWAALFVAAGILISRAVNVVGIGIGLAVVIGSVLVAWRLRKVGAAN